jgi:hypothetical protein
MRLKANSAAAVPAISWRRVAKPLLRVRKAHLPSELLTTVRGSRFFLARRQAVANSSAHPQFAASKSVRRDLAGDGVVEKDAARG